MLAYVSSKLNFDRSSVDIMVGPGKLTDACLPFMASEHIQQYIVLQEIFTRFMFPFYTVINSVLNPPKILAFSDRLNSCNKELNCTSLICNG